LIPLSVPEIRGREWEYVKECLDTGWISSVGSFVDRFEALFATKVGRKYAVATSSGTAALHIALLATGIEPEDEVVTTALTFIASANAVTYMGAQPVFVDVDPVYLQLDPQKLESFLVNECSVHDGSLINKNTGRRVRAILPVHILGHPCDMDAIQALAKKFDLLVIEDAAESIGATYKGQPVGTFSDVACFSFNGNKLISTGGGGMIATDNEQLANRARYLSTQAKDDPVEYIHGEVGYNYRLTNVLAAIGLAQLEMLDEFVQTKREIARRYAEAFKHVDAILAMPQAEWAESSYWLYTILLEDQASGPSARELLKSLDARGIQTRPLWEPLDLSAAYVGSYSTEITVAHDAYRRALSIPCSVGLSEDDHQTVIDALVECVQAS
jgi:perosamine synthetase